MWLTWQTDVFDVPAGLVVDFYAHWNWFSMVECLRDRAETRMSETVLDRNTHTHTHLLLWACSVWCVDVSHTKQTQSWFLLLEQLCCHLGWTGFSWCWYEPSSCLEYHKRTNNKRTEHNWAEKIRTSFLLVLNYENVSLFVKIIILVLSTEPFHLKFHSAFLSITQRTMRWRF